MLGYRKTRAVKVNIGIRKKPTPFGKPGYLRVDSVHQGDLEKEKGVYHINLVDEVTQWAIVSCVEGMSEQFLAPLLETLLELFPFFVLGFHSDYLNPHLNFHRHCAYATDYTDSYGKVRKTYETYMTPCQKLLSNKNIEQYLKPGITKGSLLQEQMKLSHVEAAEKLQTAKAKLFNRM